MWDRFYRELFFLIIITGPLVLITYYQLYKSKLASQSWAGLSQKSVKITWFISMALTVISWIYITTRWIFDETLESNKNVFLSYVLFMSGALLWTPFTIISLHRKTRLATVWLALYLTAAGSISLLIQAAFTSDIAMIFAAAISAIHHLLLDAIYWWGTWKVDTKKNALEF